METAQKTFLLKGQSALITGGATGIGLAMAECMVSAGAKVILVGRGHEQQMKDACKKMGGNACYYLFDVTDTSHTEEFVSRIVSEQGEITILCNNAGNHCKKSIEEMSVEDFTSVLDVHLVGAFALTKALVPHMKKNGKGNILFTCSMASYMGLPGILGYAAAKSGMLGMIRTLATEISASGIRVNGIAPGWIDTPMFHKAVDNDPARRDKILGRTPMAKFGETVDIGWAAVFLCSDAAKFINGVVLPVDGGALIGF